MADHNSQVQIRKFSLLEDSLDNRLLEAFVDYETENLQFGAAWLTNLASHALDEHETAVIFVARLTENDFVACPLKLNSRNGQAYSLSTFYTSAYSPIVHSDSPETLFTALFQHLRKIEKLAAITLSPMDMEISVFDLVYHSLAQAGWRGRHTFFCFGNWIHELNGVSYQSYLASRPSILKNTIARKTRKFLDKDKGYLEIVQDIDSLESAIDQYIAVYNSSWKKEEPYPDFIPQLMRLSAKRGWLRLGIARYDSKPIASQIWLVAEDTAYIFKLAYHKDYSRLSPGTVLTAFMMDHVIDTDAVSQIDYLSGDDSYKKHWMTLRRERHGIAAYNPGTLRGLAMLIGHSLRGLLKKVSLKHSTANNNTSNVTS